MYGEFERKVWVLNQSGDMERGEGVINGTITLVDDQAVPIDFGATAWNDITGVPVALTAAQADGTASIRAIGTTATTAAAGDHTHTDATTTAAGFMSDADKVKLNGIVPTAAPTIAIPDPVDDDSVIAAFDALIGALRASGILT
jgi:hypothetical protein